MATADFWLGNDMHGPDLTSVQDADAVSETAKRLELFNATDGNQFIFTGQGFTYDAGQVPTGGTVASFSYFKNGGADLALTFKHLNVQLTDVAGFVQANDGDGLLLALFSGNDVMTVHSTGQTQLTGLAGNDKFVFGANFVTGDSVDGGDGIDTLVLSGDYGIAGTPFVFALGAVTNVEKISLGAGHFFLKTDNANIAAGTTLTVDGGHSDLLVFNASQEFDGSVNLTGGSGADGLIGGAQRDIIVGGGGTDFIAGLGGRDQLTGGGGADTFFYSGAGQSLAAAPDWITDLNGSADKIDLPFAVSALLAPVTAATLGALGTVLDPAHFGAHAAVLATVDIHTYLVVDMDGTAGFSAGTDLVIKIDGATGLAHLNAGSFI